MNFSELEKLFTRYETEKIVIVGLGNTCCSDDSAGLMLWEKLQQQKVFKKAHFINAGCNPENYLMEILESSPDLVIFADAAEDKGLGGVKIYHSDEIDDKDFSTHAYSIGLIEKFLKMNIDCDVRYLGIAIQNSRPGKTISGNVVNQINKFF
ncbi:MAG: hydrogenase maturation protease [Candidatus Marinimicrobia bacterium]|nr:hydrogenase maturation protease [Candidatus Neomarinimicrobiota bacterium]